MVEKEFREVIIKSGKSAVVLFHMSGCPFCREFRPKFHELSKTRGVLTAQLDISNYDSGLWEEYHIEAVPTVIAFKDGLVCARADSTPHVCLNLERLMEEMRKKLECFSVLSDTKT
jgi:thioredoxin-like negative regulator of GroEL